jgi:hypothetical protein
MAKKNTDATNESAPLITVTLIMPHTHGGKDYAPGEIIEVTQAQESWLAQRGIIAPNQPQSGE